MSSVSIEKGYEPGEVEKRWYEYWEKERLFSAEEGSGGSTYAIVIPPPNVTGVLHMGHALNITLQDVLCRYHRLRGDNVLWMPGTDHAGIATQNVVERKLAEEGLNRDQLGREKFVEAVWRWRREYGGAIINQLKRLGASCDWERERFTMDEGLSRAVRKVFVDLYHQGLIYRGNYIINWCPRCRTALADLEVEHEELQGNLYAIRYPYANGSGGIVIATTRPETMLGDTAVAVHPDDERYRELGSDRVILPLVQREIPVIRDPYVDMAFGTGALKITPAHDPNDFEIGNRHRLDRIKVIGEDGRMTAEAGKFEGMDRFSCRKAVVEALKAEGLLVRVDPYLHGVGHCYRCKTIIEPNLSLQWFVRTKPLAEKAIRAVEDGKTKIIPSTWENTYFEWMRNIRDWCISRQIWWGHQIPAWTCRACGEVIVAMEDPRCCPGCGTEHPVRETDVLDTWFSSALWPFSTMGWPEKTPLLASFYPTSVLVTGFDILFFWVARMMMMGLHFMKEVPFHDVYVHALVRDEDGKKMSKSLGNVIDPLTVIDQYGTDAFRMTLAAFAAQGRDIKMSEKRVEGYRHFINKLWNAARFALMHLTPEHTRAAFENDASRPSALSLADRWILSRLQAVTRSVADALSGYRFNEAAGALYHFVWHEFCDWYLEAIKPVLYDEERAQDRPLTLQVLWRVLRDTLVLLHPFTPFVTEEIWHRLPGTEGSVMRASFPADESLRFEDRDAESSMNLVIAIVTGIRNIRGEMNLPPSSFLDSMVSVNESALREKMTSLKDFIIHLARLRSFSIHETAQRPRAAATAVVDGAVIYIPLEGVIDFNRESERLEKEIGKIAQELESVSKKLRNEAFLNKAPDDVVSKVKDKHATLTEKYDKLQVNLERIKSLGGK
ncbi:MAG: valine--tRNA ligase [Desulfobacteraceae bacterium]|nr:MAG: valine--tRNA ligase [Desulfobacteraceae bacterium]